MWASTTKPGLSRKIKNGVGYTTGQSRCLPFI